MHDVHEDASVPVRSEPPRRLSGLHGFFERHEVGVNDRLVLQFDEDASVRVQVEAVSRPAQRDTGAAEPVQVDPQASQVPRPSTEVPAEKRVAAAPAQTEVVDRFGRVTVRRLGAGRGREVPPPSVPARVPPPPTEPATAPAPEGSRAAMARPESARPEKRGEAPAAPVASGERSAPPTHGARPTSPERRVERPAPPVARPEEPAAPAEAPPVEAPVDAPVEARRAHLNARGDLRTQVVRYLLRPETPVILRVEVVAERFSLEPSVARDVMAGIAQDPPPSLAVEAVREDMYRVARVTVEQDA